jgi:hypothetical protein
MRNAEKSTCSAVGNPFELFLDARISKSISNLASRERTGKPAFLITRLAQSRRDNINLFPAKSLRCGVQCLSHILMLLDEGTSLRLRDPVLFREIRELVGLACSYPTTIRRSAFRFVVRHVASPKDAFSRVGREQWHKGRCCWRRWPCSYRSRSTSVEVGVISNARAQAGYDLGFNPAGKLQCDGSDRLQILTLRLRP